MVRSDRQLQEWVKAFECLDSSNSQVRRGQGSEIRMERESVRQEGVCGMEGGKRLDGEVDRETGDGVTREVLRIE